ncbi:DNA replication/repair protein RecF [Pseudohalioglobus sediminis]|uniref:DNA replication and repair protein RecF n=1 Tax=Pseudohalioglobus sediminis TaxID=2606449 RepID=A0A5B0WVZ9_9GAMM|nr:DNA replication/repair protein RecF [Pseudohalioglobus sediminis]KAA1190545.1 DNA replication/repair protein RecF [Pseudohalioglobus sediminis]
MSSEASLSRLHINNVRNLHRVRLDQLKRVNVFHGANGSGKTSILESIHLLGMARSFRGGAKALITHGEQDCTVFGALAPGNTTLGVQRSRSGDVKIKVAGAPVRTVAELVEYLPLQVINADSFDLLTGSPGARRQYLDWGVFHVEHRFFEQWQRFQRSIKQRNKLLRRDKMPTDDLPVWTRELARSGEALSKYREAYFKLLTPRFKAIMSQLAPSLTGLELRFRRGWDKSLDFQGALDNSLAVDLEQGYTHVGPQRADVRIQIDGHLASETLSRGQQKLVVCGLKLAQGQLMSEADRGRCTYLVDDLPSELDGEHSALVCKLLASMKASVFITCVHQRDIEAVWPEQDLSETAMFHVEHGSVSQP